MDYYILGILFGVSFALIVAAIVFYIQHKKHPNYGKYDERQIVGRGKAFQAGFFTLLIVDTALNVWEYCAGTLPGIPFLWHISAILLGVAVFALTAIHYDAYVGMYNSPKRFMRMGIIFIIAMILSSSASLSGGREEGYVTAFIDIAIAVLWALIVAALVIHRRRAREEDEE